MFPSAHPSQPQIDAPNRMLEEPVLWTSGLPSVRKAEANDA
ncbi:hypothetical protein SAMN05216259_11728 [Actinacidiphila guanduensis]|jgi:hypothetical protein|uniref:Uncharacterized protein n=1 Tax=Actinacidiphila guanduensis TaxID=310781 RepID=A0A1H0PVI3_9ACTN|nr:hypothetical protein SAMN05216259_11728 [Actinacidiphila guanduensis]